MSLVNIVNNRWWYIVKRSFLIKNVLYVSIAQRLKSTPDIKREMLWCSEHNLYQRCSGLRKTCHVLHEDIAK
jgi:hypothetical protein